MQGYTVNRLWLKCSFPPCGRSGLEFGGFRETEVALGKCIIEKFLDLRFFAVARHRQFADQQVAGAFEHLFFAKGKRLRLMKGDKALENSGDLEERAGPHTVGVFFEAVFPVGGAEVVGDGKEIQNFLHLAVADDTANADAANVVARHHHLETAGLNVEEVELFHRSANRTAADLFDNADPVVGIDDLVANVEIQVRTVHKKAPGQEKGLSEGNVYRSINRVLWQGAKSKD